MLYECITKIERIFDKKKSSKRNSIKYLEKNLGQRSVKLPSRKIREDDFERLMVRRLLSLGLRPAIRSERAGADGTCVEDIMLLP